MRTDREPITVIIPTAGIPPDSLKPLLRETPLCMLDVNGKSLLQRNIEIMNKLGIYDINVVTGYKHNKINIEGANLIYNEDYEKIGMLGSIMKAKDKMDGKILIINGDILFEPTIIEQLLKHEEDIVAVIDKSYKESKFLDKKLDLVIAKYPPLKGDRVLSPDKGNIILKIGKDIQRKEANYEFTGITMFSTEGVKLFKKTLGNYKDFNKADMAQALQEMIKNGNTIFASVISEGWIEINTFKNYKDVCEMLSKLE